MAPPGSHMPLLSHAHGPGTGQQPGSLLEQPQVIGSSMHGSRHEAGSSGLSHGGAHPGSVGSPHGEVQLPSESHPGGRQPGALGSVQPPPPPPPQLPFESHGQDGSVVGSHGVQLGSLGPHGGGGGGGQAVAGSVGSHGAQLGSLGPHGGGGGGSQYGSVLGSHGGGHVPSAKQPGSPGSLIPPMPPTSNGAVGVQTLNTRSFSPAPLRETTFLTPALVITSSR